MIAFVCYEISLNNTPRFKKRSNGSGKDKKTRILLEMKECKWMTKGGGKNALVWFVVGERGREEGKEGRGKGCKKGSREWGMERGRE